MPFWYNAPAKDSKFATISASKWSEANTKLTFGELAIKEDDTYYHLFGQCLDATDVINAKERGWKFEPQLLQVKIAKKEYQKWNSTEKKNETVQQSIVESFFATCFSQLDLTKVYQGKVILQSIPQMEMIFEQKESDPDMSQKVLEMTAKSMCTLVECLEPTIIKLDEITIPTKSNNGFGGGSKAQSESDRLIDRMRFIKEQVKLALPDVEINSTADLVAAFENPVTASKISTVYSFIKDVLA
ncbi:hypothetical protein [Scytonema sp. NUACC26]|uniref:hypothetical protein n=1 Tax=Scytonema sp. NUACC26 TaxID=3140176 RepID=UPI0034DBDEFC